MRKLFIGQLLHFGFEFVDGVALLAVLLDKSVIAGAEHLGENRFKHNLTNTKRPETTGNHSAPTGGYPP